MQKAMFLLESYKKGILAELDAGYILTVNVPDYNDIERKLDPYRMEMVSYSGVKSIHQLNGGLKFISSGRKIFCLIEPANYPKNYVEPSFRSQKTTEHIPFRFKECDIYFTGENKYRVLLPSKPVECYDSFTVEFPLKGDICVLYFIFNDNVNEIVLPYIGKNVELILKNVVKLPTIEAKKISNDFLLNVRKFHVLD
jgi:hypothetical protein